jgi:hypothetical protein
VDEVATVRELAKRLGNREVARRLGADHKAVGSWLAGKTSPGPKAREAIRALAVARETTRAAEPPAKADGDPPTDTDDPRENARATLKRLRFFLDRAESSREAAPLANAITASSRLLAQLTGEIDISEVMLLRSLGWARIKAAMIESVRPYPDALKALADAIENLSVTA